MNIPFRWLRIIFFPLAASLAFINILKVIIRLGFPWQVCTHVPVCFPSPFLSWYCYYSCAEWRSGRLSRVPTRAKAFSRVEEEMSCRKAGKAVQGGREAFLESIPGKSWTTAGLLTSDLWLSHDSDSGKCSWTWMSQHWLKAEEKAQMKQTHKKISSCHLPEMTHGMSDMSNTHIHSLADVSNIQKRSFYCKCHHYGLHKVN